MSIFLKLRNKIFPTPFGVVSQKKEKEKEKKKKAYAWLRTS